MDCSLHIDQDEKGVNEKPNRRGKQSFLISWSRGETAGMYWTLIAGAHMYEHMQMHAKLELASCPCPYGQSLCLAFLQKTTHNSYF